MTNITAKPGDVITVVAADAPAGAPNMPPEKKGVFGMFGGKRGRKGSRKVANGRKENNAVTRKQGGGKRKMSGYFKFMQQERKNIEKELGAKAGVTDVAKEAGKRWRALSDSEKSKY
jgi:hypothetical protein